MKHARLPLFGLLVACGETAQFVPREGAQSLIIARAQGGGWALEARPFDSERVAIEVERDHEAYLLFYGEALGELGLGRGAIAQDPPDLELPVPDRSVRVGPEGPQILAGAPGVVETLRIARSDPCLRITPVEQGDLPGAGSFLFGLEIDQRRSLVATASGGYYWADADGLRPAEEMPADTPKGAGFWHAPSGELWLLDGASGRVVHGHPSRGFARAADLPVRSRQLWVDGARGDAPFELFVVTASRAIYRFDGGAWHERSGPIAPSSNTGDAQIAWAGPGKAVALADREDRVLEDTGVAVREVVIPDLQSGVRNDKTKAVRYLEAFGPLLGSKEATLYTQASGGGDWRLLYRAPSGTATFFIEALSPQAILFGGEDGVVAQYQPQIACPSQLFSTQEGAHIKALLVAGDEHIAFYNHGGLLLWTRAEVR